MNDAFKKACELIGSANLARKLDVSPQAVNAVKKGDRPVPAAWCQTIETETGGEVCRTELRPNDWQKYWPDLSEEHNRRATDKPT